MSRFVVAPLALLALAGAALGDPGRTEVGPVVQGSNAFAVDLFGRLRQNEGNVVFSPYALSSALALTSAGARGRTLDELDRAVHLIDQEDLHLGYLALGKSVDRETERSSGYRVTVACDLRGGRGTVFRPDFVALARSSYGAGPGRNDLVSADRIRLVSGEVPGDIPAAAPIEPAGPDAPLPLTLASTMTFKGRWVAGFPAAAPGPFTRGDGSKVTADLMRQTGRFAYAETDKLQILELPYADGGLRLVVLLPKKPEELPEIEKGLSLATLPSTLNRVEPRPVTVTLPRCRIAAETSLKKPLTQLGLGISFGAGADFSGLTESRRAVYLADVVQRAALELDAAGGAPAASRAEGQGSPVVFQADRPFLFVLRDADNGGILLMGRLADPTR